VTASLILLAQQATQTPAPGGGTDRGVTLIIAVVLLATAIGLFAVELFVPSGGVLGFLSALCLVAGVVMLCVVNLTWGLVAGVIAVCALPFAVGFALSIWPDTPIGRWLTLSESQEAVTQRPDARHEADPRVGMTGRALTDLRPIGACQIGDKREQCIATRGMIEQGDTVRVVAVEGMEIRVEKLTG